jgi:hypothetical protein
LTDKNQLTETFQLGEEGAKQVLRILRKEEGILFLELPRMCSGNQAMILRDQLSNTLPDREFILLPFGTRFLDVEDAEGEPS